MQAILLIHSIVFTAALSALYSFFACRGGIGGNEIGISLLEQQKMADSVTVYSTDFHVELSFSWDSVVSE